MWLPLPLRHAYHVHVHGVVRSVAQGAQRHGLFAVAERVGVAVGGQGHGLHLCLVLIAGLHVIKTLQGCGQVRVRDAVFHVVEVRLVLQGAVLDNLAGLIHGPVSPECALIHFLSPLFIRSLLRSAGT